MGRRSRRRLHEALARGSPLREEPAPPAVYDSGLLEGQPQPEMRVKLQRIGEGLRARSGTISTTGKP